MDETLAVDVREGLIRNLMAFYMNDPGEGINLPGLLESARQLEAYILANENPTEDAAEEQPSPGYERDRQTYEAFQRDLFAGHSGRKNPESTEGPYYRGR